MTKDFFDDNLHKNIDEEIIHDATESEHDESITTESNKNPNTKKTSRLQFNFQRIYIGYAVGGMALLFGLYLLIHSTLSNVGSSKQTTYDAQKEGVTPETEMNVDMKSVPLVEASSSGVSFSELHNQQLKILVERLNNMEEEIKKGYLELAKNMKIIKTELDHVHTWITQHPATAGKNEQTNIQLAQIYNLLVTMNVSRIKDTEPLRLTAISDGRAWLENNKGQVRTVIKGDLLEEYGKVLQVDTERNEVITSSGYIFK